MNEQTILFEKDNYICEATVTYTPPQGKWNADSDNDYNGGFDIVEMTVFEDDYPVDQHSVTWEDVIRHYEIVMETSQLEQQLSNVDVDDCGDSWEEY